MEPITLTLIILASISIGASAVAFYYDELAEGESEQKEQLTKAFNEYVSSQEAEIENKRNNYYSLLKDAINYQREQKFKIKEDFKNALQNINAINKTGEFTTARKRAFDRLYLNFKEQISRVYGYLDYVRFYSKQLDELYNTGKTLPEALSYILPDNYPYDGKLMYVNYVELSENGFKNEFNIEYELTDVELKNNFEENSQIPVLVNVIYDNIEHRNEYKLSISKGILKTQLQNQGICFEAQVKKVENNYSILEYCGLKLRLNRERQENNSKRYIRGIYVNVYPYYWFHNLNEIKDNDESNVIMQVTEKWEQSINETYFNEIPIIIADSFLQEFIEKLDDYENSSERWLISPSKNDQLKELSYVKLQLGYDIAFECSIEGININNPKDSKPYFKFVKYLNEEEKIKHNDIYAGFAVTIVPLSDNEYELFQDKYYDNFNTLYFFLIEEFIQQKKIIENNQGSLYFQKWSHILERLIKHISVGPEYVLEVNDIKQINKTDNRTEYGLNIKNKEGLIKYLELNTEDKIVDFFIKQENINLGVAKIDNLQNNIIRIFNTLPEIDEPISIYKKLVPLPEIKQRTALNQFRIGLLHNSSIKLFLLNPSEIKNELIDETFDKIEFIDKNILLDKNQKDTVIKSLNEKKLFLIQGPPGTGKTTVIVEIILQYLKKFPNNRILIVSQANIAVDNVIERLLKNDTLIRQDSIIRCGQDTKIFGKIKEISIETKFDKYKSEIINFVPNNIQKQYHDFWLKQIGHENEINPDIGELILQGHQIVGATCVGLANKRMGLERMTFDLVIIDEAGKATAGELLIPLIRGEKIIIVGDHFQLPPTIHRVLLNDEIPLEIEKNELEILYRQSLFERLYKGSPETNKTFLSKQYRMPPSIGTLISKLFYNGKLQNGKKEAKSKIFKKHITWIDTSKIRNYKHLIANNKSPYNNSEVDLVIMLIKSIIKKVINKKIHLTEIIVITPYTAQKFKFRRKVGDDNFFKSIPHQIDIEFNTIDAIQGRDADVVIYCTTRTSGNIDFLNDKHRLNVALSRVKSDLIVIGNISHYNRQIKTSEGKNYFFDLISYINKGYGKIIQLNEIKTSKIEKLFTYF
ncbi:MAG TPA: AAA domain-containing protein [Ignavibacteria bacterium]